MTRLADFCFTPLLWLPPESPGVSREAKLSTEFKFGRWSAKNGPKTKKIWKTSEMTRNTSKNNGFLTVFQSFLVLGPILAHQTTKFKFSGWICWGAWERQSIRIICIWKIFQLFFGCWRHLAKIFVFFKLKPDITFIILHA